jgi:hypothetical protein
MVCEIVARRTSQRPPGRNAAVAVLDNLDRRSAASSGRPGGRLLRPARRFGKNLPAPVFVRGRRPTDPDRIRRKIDLGAHTGDLAGLADAAVIRVRPSRKKD